MFTIRREQRQAIAEARRGEFHRRLAGFYREKAPDLTGRMSDDELLRVIAAGDHKARSYGVESERGIAGFIGIALAAGPNFDEDPDVLRYLTNPVPNPDAKVMTLLDLVSKKLSGTVSER